MDLGKDLHPLLQCIQSHFLIGYWRSGDPETSLESRDLITVRLLAFDSRDSVDWED